MSAAKQQDNLKRLIIGRRFGERVKIGEFWVSVERKGENQVSILIDAPAEVKIYREELLTQSLAIPFGNVIKPELKISSKGDSNDGTDNKTKLDLSNRGARPTCSIKGD